MRVLNERLAGARPRPHGRDQADRRAATGRRCCPTRTSRSCTSTPRAKARRRPRLERGCASSSRRSCGDVDATRTCEASSWGLTPRRECCCARPSSPPPRRCRGTAARSRHALRRRSQVPDRGADAGERGLLQAQAPAEPGSTSFAPSAPPDSRARASPTSTSRRSPTSSPRAAPFQRRGRVGHVYCGECGFQNPEAANCCSPLRRAPREGRVGRADDDLHAGGGFR